MTPATAPEYILRKIRFGFLHATALGSIPMKLRKRDGFVLKLGQAGFIPSAKGYPFFT
jgi:hypothetical protein